jgi:RNA polymerase sigma-70 factor (ECF subfamily)
VQLFYYKFSLGLNTVNCPYQTTHQLPDNQPYPGATTGDQELLRLLETGSEAAFRLLYDRYQPKLSRYLYPFVSDRPHLVAEIVQEVFVKLWVKRGQLGGIAKPEYYLQRLARNQLIDNIRLQKIKDRHEKAAAGASGAQEDVQDFLLLKEYHEIARQAIEQLPERRRYLLRLSMVDGYSQEEIANLTNLSRAVVKKQLFKANSFLREYMKTHGGMLLLVCILDKLS